MQIRIFGVLAESQGVGHGHRHHSRYRTMLLTNSADPQAFCCFFSNAADRCSCSIARPRSVRPCERGRPSSSLPPPCRFVSRPRLLQYSAERQKASRKAATVTVLCCVAALRALPCCTCIAALVSCQLRFLWFFLVPLAYRVINLRTPITTTSLAQKNFN